ncbi:hypothetical protein IZT72_15515 [Pseudomonas brenneri]|nr:hypothetical protein [Pseudomonas brenneri]MBF8006012.1 hypothetical protein [Pseudomonas brenneri]
MPAKNWKATRATGHTALSLTIFAGKPAPTGMASKSGQKKRATEVAQNALRAHITWKNLWFFTLVRVFPDKKTKPYKKQHHEADSQHPGENHIIEKHDRPPALALLRWG